MSQNESLTFPHPPIVEAVVDIDCDLPEGFDFASFEESGRESFGDYPAFKRQLYRRADLYVGAAGKLDVQAATSAFHLRSADKPQLVQLRRAGFSFHRFAPYSSLDDYLPEIKRTWSLYLRLVSPMAIRHIRLRYINRILLPPRVGMVDLNEYLRLGLDLPEDLSLELTTVLNQYSAVEPSTGHETNVTMALTEQERQPFSVLFDIAAGHTSTLDPQIWENIEATILSLRRLKNAIFRNSLTEQCLNLFR